MMQPPIEPMQKLLPLNNPGFEWDDFEVFCADFVYQLSYIKDCHRYGKRGNKQEGVDILAELDTGKEAVFSCKQYDNFMPSDAKKAVASMTCTADEFYLLLSCEASISVRKIWCSNGPNWHVWDIFDISRKIKELTLDKARSLIITHFGYEWVEYFLGIKGISAFVSLEEFFRKLMNPDNLFNHIYSLVGRKETLEQLDAFVESKEYSVAIIAGRGGVGKTKILQSFSQKFHKSHEGKTLLFIDDGVPITAEGANDLPTGQCIIILDDAHRCQDLPLLFAIARQRSLKLILSFRPYASERIKALLIRAKFDINEINDLGEIKDLDRKEIKDLALNVLGDKNAYLADQLVVVGWDSPLVIVVGGRLLVEKKVDPQILVHSKDFREAVLDKFQEFLVGKVTDQIEPLLCRNILELIAAITPIRIDDLKDEAAAFLGITTSDLVRSLDTLEKAGILLKRGYTLRITPDVLSDHILYRACITAEGNTGYAQRVFDDLKIVCSNNILNNLAELDWRARRSGDNKFDLFSDIWVSIENDFKNSSNLGRWQILNKLESVAYLQPGHMVPMIEYAFRNPSNIADNDEAIKYTHNDVIHQLAEILKNVAYNLDYLPRCCELLWQMGCDDQRILNQCPNHPIRILNDLAEYDINKPYIYNKTILDTIITLSKRSDIHDHFYSIFDILEPFFAKSGNSLRIEGAKMIFTPFLVDRGVVQPIYEKALGFIEDNIAKGSTKIRLKAIKCLDHAISEPFHYGGLEISEEVLKQWVPEQLHALEILEKLADYAEDPLIYLEIIDVISWEAHRSRSKEIKEKAQKIITSITGNFEFRLTRVLKNSYLHQRYHERYRDHREWIEEENCDLAQKFLGVYPDPYLGFSNLNKRLQIIKEGGIEPQSEQFLMRLSYFNQEYAISLCELIIKEPNCLLAPFFHYILCEIWNKDITRTYDLALRAVHTDHLTLCRSVALAYIWTKYHITKDDFELIEKLLGYPDIIVRTNAIRALGIMSYFERLVGTDMAFNAVICDMSSQFEDPLLSFSISSNIRRISIDSLKILALSEKRLGIDIALDVDIGNQTELADTLYSIFNEKRGIPLRDLTDEQLNILIKKLETIKDINGYNITEFFRSSFPRIPHSIIQMFFNRMKSDKCHSIKFSPLPYDGFSENIFSGVNDDSVYKKILMKIFNFALENRGNFWISILFNEVSKNSPDMSFELLNEWISTDDANKIMAVGDLLRYAPTEFVFRYPNFISNLLERSYYLGDKCYDYIRFKLSDIPFNRGFQRIRGEPSHEEVEIRNKAIEVLKQFKAGSPSYRYYDMLKTRAESSIMHDLKMDENFQDYS